jgi:hypothetical protein
MSSFEELEQLRSEVVEKGSLDVYLNTITSFLTFIVDFEPDAEDPVAINYRNPVTSQLLDFLANLTDLSPRKRKQLLKAELLKKRPIEVVDFNVLNIKHIMLFILSLNKRDGSKPVFSTYNTHRAGINHLYRMYKEKKPDDFEEEIAIYFRSLKKRAAKNAQEGGQSVSNAKKPLPFEVYRLLAGHFMKNTGGKNQEDALSAAFGHLFWLICWNTMSRAKNTATVSLTHLDWSSDALLVYICQAKNDQEGDKGEHPKHIFANPVFPEICAILSLGLFLSLVQHGNTKLFEGENQAGRFRRLLGRLVDSETVLNDLRSCGFDKKKLGIHSERKGAASFCASGTTNPPSQSSIDIRGGWSQGKIKDVYQHHQDAGDQYVGRTVAGLPRNMVEFATLPPHFNAEVNNQFLEDTIRAVFPFLLQSQLLIGKFCLASLVYHSDYLRRTLPSDHIIFNTYLFRNANVLDVLKPNVVCGLPYKDSTISATGLPPDILLSLEIRDIPVKISEILETRSILANSVTPHYIQSLLTSHYNQLKSLYEESRTNSHTANTAADTTPENAEQTQWRAYNWGGSFRRLPENYVLPKVTLHVIWQHWWIGEHGSVPIPPLRTVAPRDLKDFRRLSELKFVMNKMETILRENNRLVEKPNIIEVNSMYNFAFEKLNLGNLTSTSRERRQGQLQWTTVAKDLRKSRNGSSTH